MVNANKPISWIFGYCYNVSSLIKTKTTDLDEYKSEISPYFDNNSVIEEIYGMAQSAVNIQIDNTNDDEDTSNLMCDCEFTLAYGTKVLLRNTNLKLRKGSKYGL